jgi:hypothetical protein
MSNNKNTIEKTSLLNLIKTNRNSFYKFFLKNEGYNSSIQKILDKMDENSKHIPSDMLIRWICNSGIFSNNIIKNNNGFLNTESIHKFIIKLTYLFVHFKSRCLVRPTNAYFLSPSVSSPKLNFIHNETNWGFTDVINYISFYLVQISGKPVYNLNSDAHHQPTWTASIFLTSPAVNCYQDMFNVSFTKYFFPIVINAIAFYEIFPKGSIHLMYDSEGAFQSNLSNINISSISFPNKSCVSALEKFLQVLLLHQSQFNNYEEDLNHKIRTKLQELVLQTLAELPPENMTFEFLFVYLLNKCSPSPNQLRIFRYTVSSYFRTHDGHRLGINLKKIPEISGEISGHGYIGQSMRFFFLRQKSFIFQDKRIQPPSFCLFMDAHTFGFCSASHQVFEAFRENYLRCRLKNPEKSTTKYLFSHNYSYSRSWHTPLPIEMTKKYQYSKKSPICGFIGVIGNISDNESMLMTDIDYQETFGRLTTFRENPLGRINFSCDLDYGNDEFLIGYLFQKYADPRQKDILYFPLHYFYGPHNIFNIYQEENEQLVMKRIFRVCYSKLADFIPQKNKLLQIRDIKKYLGTNTYFPDNSQIPFYFKYCVPSHLNFVCAYACSENIVYPYLGTEESLADLNDDEQVGKSRWKIPDKLIGFKILQGLKLNIHELFFSNILTTWLTDHILPDNIQPFIQIKTIDEYRYFYKNIFKPIVTNPLLPQFMDISSLRNFRDSKSSQLQINSRRQIKIKRPLAHTQKNLMVNVVR